MKKAVKVISFGLGTWFAAVSVVKNTLGPFSKCTESCGIAWCLLWIGNLNRHQNSSWLLIYLPSWCCLALLFFLNDKRSRITAFIYVFAYTLYGVDGVSMLCMDMSMENLWQKWVVRNHPSIVYFMISSFGSHFFWFPPAVCKISIIGKLSVMNKIFWIVFFLRIFLPSCMVIEDFEHHKGPEPYEMPLCHKMSDQ